MKTFLSKYAGNLQITDNAEEEYNKHRVNKYGVGEKMNNKIDLERMAELVKTFDVKGIEDYSKEELLKKLYEWKELRIKYLAYDPTDSMEKIEKEISEIESEL